MSAINPTAIPSVVTEDLVVCMRSVVNGGFGDSVGTTTYLKVKPPQDNPTAAPSDPIAVNIPSPGDGVQQDDWFELVIKEASRGFTPLGSAVAGQPTPIGGDVLVLIHGFNNDQKIVMQHHRQLRKDLTARGFNGALVSFDWPSGSSALGYIDDRIKAAGVAVRLVNDLVFPFVARVRLGNCLINVHVLGHSTGAYLFQETVDMSDEHHGIAAVNWTISQLLLIGADIDQHAMAEGDGDGESMIRHATRVTNYSNPYDEVLKLSNAKRLGLDPRIGRVGLPADAPQNCVDVNCGDYYSNFRMNTPAPCPLYGTLCHSWHIGDPVWTDDLLLTLQGNWDRHVFPTRAIDEENRVTLQVP